MKLWRSVLVAGGVVAWMAAGGGRCLAAEEEPFLRSELIFPLEHWHNHGSTIVECPNGELLVCWYHGSGERTADDVLVRGARKERGNAGWSDPFVMADTPGYPDTNPTMFIDPQQRLWLIWPVVLANRWETALLKYVVASDYQGPGAPRWSRSEVLHVTPGTNFASLINAGLDRLVAGPAPDQPREEFLKWVQEKREAAANKLSCRLGWMTRVHPLVIEGKRLIVPLYSDGFDFSLMAMTDDWGATWFTSEPLVGPGNVQPSLVRRRDGTLLAFMRDNGPPPQRVMVSESKDCGMTWSAVVDSDRVDSGSGVEALVLKSGNWILLHNDLEKGRHRLAVSLSEDEGRSWKWTRYLERDGEADLATGPGSYSYPSVIQSRDGTLHATYSYREPRARVRPGADGKPASSAIKHAHFNEAWVRGAR